MQVLKFGGTSVASAENIRKSLVIVAAAAAKSPVVMVVSALGGTTDLLIGAGRAAATGNAAYRNALAQLAER
ncbi:amino acid kinase family protein, partial [Hymenobacter agri]